MSNNLSLEQSSQTIDSPSSLARSLTNAVLTKDYKMNVNIIQGVVRIGVRGRRCKY